MNGNSESQISKKLDDIIQGKNLYSTGKVVRVNEFIIEVTGIGEVSYFEKVMINNEENIGYVDKISSNSVTIALVKTNNEIKVGDLAIATGEEFTTSFSESSLGLIIDPFGYDRMTGKKVLNSRQIKVETPNIPIMDRTSVNRPLETGIAAIDMMFPIGRGQRQLIIGDKKTGKTQIALDTIANQKDKNVICIYVSIGKTKKELKNIYSNLVKKGANSYTLIVSVFNDEPAPIMKLTPFIAMSIAQEYLAQGKDVLVVFDDLKKHADAAREIALISEKNTARDAYPADIFYTHSRLLEKGCQHKNGGSITVLPIVETKGGDITDYISTNIISITDGQIVLSEKQFQKGQKPAVNYGLSVSRLGGAVQNEAMKILGSKVRRELLSYLESASVYQLVNEDQMTEDLKIKIKTGNKLLNLFKQPKFSPLAVDKMINMFDFILDADTKNKIQMLNTITKPVSSNSTNINTVNERKDGNVTTDVPKIKQNIVNVATSSAIPTPIQKMDEGVKQEEKNNNVSVTTNVINKPTISISNKETNEDTKRS